MPDLGLSPEVFGDVPDVPAERKAWDPKIAKAVLDDYEKKAKAARPIKLAKFDV